MKRTMGQMLACVLMGCSSAHEVVPVADAGAQGDAAPEPCEALVELAAERGYEIADCREAVDCGECAGCAYFIADSMLWQPSVPQQCGVRE